MIISKLSNKEPQSETIVENDAVVSNEKQALNALFKVVARQITFKLVYKTKGFYQFKSKSGHEFTVKNNNKKYIVRGFYLNLTAQRVRRKSNV